MFLLGAILEIIGDMEDERNASFIGRNSSQPGIGSISVEVEVFGVPSSVPTFIPLTPPTSSPSVSLLPTTSQPSSGPLSPAPTSSIFPPSIKPNSAPSPVPSPVSGDSLANNKASDGGDDGGDRALFGLFALLALPAGALGYYFGTRRGLPILTTSGEEQPNTPIPQAPTTITSRQQFV